MYLLCDDNSVIGTPFFIMEYIEGRVLNPDELLKLKPNEINDIIYEVADVLSILHSK
jgi:aminoglycoside phosphotransferase (APT) family kinase protein